MSGSSPVTALNSAVSPLPSAQGARPMAVAARYIASYITPTCLRVALVPDQGAIQHLTSAAADPASLIEFIRPAPATTPAWTGCGRGRLRGVTHGRLPAPSPAGRRR